MDVVKCETADFLNLSMSVLGRGASLRFQARGNSMRPLINDGDVLDIVPCNVNDPAIGEVILFHTDRKGILVHRLVKIVRAGNSDPFLTTKGDATRQPDAPIQATQVLGKVVSACGQDGRIRAIDRGVYGFMGQLIARYPTLTQCLRLLPHGIRSLVRKAVGKFSQVPGQGW